MRLSWMDKALCREVGGDLWHHESGEGSVEAINMAKRVCRRCPVQIECLQFALENNETYGVWGATAATERRKMRARSRGVA